ncbi:MAG: hypothetical protein QW520_07365 [Methanomassiliicoccales archaeon]
MAKKRVISRTVTSVEKKAEIQEKTWRQWLHQTYAKYWYAVACMFADVAIFLELRRSAIGGWILSLLSLLILVILQIILFNKIWPKENIKEE